VNLGATFKFVGKDSLKYEAENGLFNKTVLESTHEGFSGKGYANLDNEVGSSVTLSVVTAGEGDKDVKIVFANGSTANRPVSIAVNGKVQVESVDFESTGAWESWDSSVVTLKLPAGASTITIASLTKDGGPNIDRIEFVNKNAVIPVNPGDSVVGDSGTTVLQRIPVRSNTLRNSGRNFLVNGRSAGALKNHASKIKIYSK
jgi:hypothetical protein